MLCGYFYKRQGFYTKLLTSLLKAMRIVIKIDKYLKKKIRAKFPIYDPSACFGWPQWPQKMTAIFQLVLVCHQKAIVKIQLRSLCRFRHNIEVEAECPLNQKGWVFLFSRSWSYPTFKKNPLWYSLISQDLRWFVQHNH